MKKTNNNKGFTLVELIVVLVILAILAAILVPALLGYIDRAREKQYVLNAKSALTATQAEFSSLYGAGKSMCPASVQARASVISRTADTPDGTHFYTVIQDGVEATSANHAAYTVTKAYYVEKGFYIVYDGSAWETYDADTYAAAIAGDTYTMVY